ncbi:MAG: 6-carboxytetrahydropterin synthase [Cyclobacteriaceae bacterium]|nr:6-carboxytetrahydropterin synthase [Cyclobacteriaceae bacterium]
MISITKIFRFEAAHAIYKYPGSCQNIHGHSYELQVTVQAEQLSEDFIHGLGISIDFKDLKTRVQEAVIKVLDHKLILSKAYLAKVKNTFSPDELVIFDFEPTAENLLIFSRNQIRSNLPEHIQLKSLRLYETRDSFADWSDVK